MLCPPPNLPAGAPVPSLPQGWCTLISPILQLSSLGKRWRAAWPLLLFVGTKTLAWRQEGRGQYGVLLPLPHSDVAGFVPETKEGNQTQPFPGPRVELLPKLDAGFQNTCQEQGSMNLCGPGSDNQTQRVTPESQEIVFTLFTKPPF